MNTLVLISSFLALTAIAGLVWQGTISLIQRRAIKIGAAEVKDFVRLREDPWCQAYISIAMTLNSGLLVVAYMIKRTMLE